MSWLKQNTAVDKILGPFVDDVDFKTAETGLTIAQADIRLSKNGAAFAQTHNNAGATHREGGDYKVPLDATDTDTLGDLRVRISVAGALAVWRDFEVVPANVWDSFFGADRLQVDVEEIGAGLITAATLAADAITNAKIADGALTAEKLAADTITAAKVAADVSQEIRAEIDSNSTQLAAIKAKTDNLPSDPADDSDIDAQLATIASYIDTEIAAIKAKTDNLPSDPADASDIAALFAGISAKLPAALSSGGFIKAIVSAFDDAAFVPFTVQADGGNTASTFKTNRTEAADDYWKAPVICVITSGALDGQAARLAPISAYNGTSKFLTLATALTGVPAAGVTGILINR